MITRHTSLVIFFSTLPFVAEASPTPRILPPGVLLESEQIVSQSEKNCKFSDGLVLRVGQNSRCFSFASTSDAEHKKNYQIGYNNWSSRALPQGVFLNSQTITDSGRTTCIFSDGVKLDLDINTPCIDNSNRSLNTRAGYQENRDTNIEQPSSEIASLQNTCASLGFQRGTTEFSSCALSLYQSKKQSEIEQSRYLLELRQFQAEQSRLAAVEKDQERRDSQAKWEALQRFGTGMAQSQSSTFAGGLADGNAAMLGLPPANQASGRYAAPAPARPDVVRIRTPDGNWVTCNTFGSVVTCH
jgi:hypothetical protein